MYDLFEQLCTKRGVTAYQVCKATGISASTISSWKNGRYQPKQEKLQLIADYFDVSLDYFTGHTDKPADIPFPVSSLEREMILSFRKMTQSQKELVLSMFHLDLEAEETKTS